MPTSCYELLDGTLAPVTRAEALSRWRTGQGAFWIDASELSGAEFGELLDELGVSGLLKQRSLEVGRSTTVIAVPKGTVAEWTLFKGDNEVQRGHGGALCLERLLLTLELQPTQKGGSIGEDLNQLELERVTLSGLLCALLLIHAQVTARVTRDLRAELLTMAEEMDRGPQSVDTADLEELKHRVVLTNAVADDQREAFDLLPHASSAGFDPESCTGPLGFVRTLAAANERLADRNVARVDNLLRRAQDYKTEILNGRLAVLTIISAIFMPLTLLAGIWGMNFEHMPELDEPLAYYGALSLMATIAIVGAWIFYKRGWFD